jgi:hypothetical protein
MVLHLIFKVKQNCDSVQKELARREICWLIKDGLRPGTAAGHAQAGFSFVLAQVAPATFEELITLLHNRFESVGTVTYFKKLLENLLEPDKQDYFIVPLKEQIDLKPLVNRLVFTESISIISGNPSENTVETLPCTQYLWLSPFSKGLFAAESMSSEDLSMFNVSHPYQEGFVVNVTNGILADLQSYQIVESDDFAKYSNRIASSFVTTEFEQNNGIFQSKKIEDIFEKLSSWSLQGVEMKSAISHTGALSAANILFIIRHKDSLSAESAKNLQKALGDLVAIGDKFGFSIHLLITDWNNLRTFLVLKKHPRDPILDELGPKFNSEHEIRKLAQVEGFRKMHPGYKGPYGNKEISQKMTHPLTY